MIVKIQIPLTSNENDSYALVYDKTRVFMEMIPITDDLLVFLDGDVKGFFRVTIDDEKTSIFKRVENQEW
jgi:hypothetical protein